MPIKNTLTLHANGPLELRGEVALAGAPLGGATTLCRCGHSGTKPFCDGSHGRRGFAASGTAAGLETVANPQAHGVVDVRPIQDGPLRIDGAVEVLSDAGERFGHATQLWLCRCGESRRKPFCDGTHKRSGFRADGEVPPQKSQPTETRQERGSDG
jgi:CDGSH-type Zn-finger protein